jgi:hypothetical protein
MISNTAIPGIPIFFILNFLILKVYKNPAHRAIEKTFRYSDGVGCAILGDGRFVLWSLEEHAQVIEGFPKDLQEFWPDLHPYRNKILGALTLSNNNSPSFVMRLLRTARIK